eukprot:5371599-Amphidinium_carterae.1
MGLFCLIDAECLMPKATDNTLLAKIYKVSSLDEHTSGHSTRALSLYHLGQTVHKPGTPRSTGIDHDGCDSARAVVRGFLGVVSLERPCAFLQGVRVDKPIAGFMLPG